MLDVIAEQCVEKGWLIRVIECGVCWYAAMIHPLNHNLATKAEVSVGRVKINYNRAEQALEGKRRRSRKLYATQPRAVDLPEACGIGEPVTYLTGSRTPGRASDLQSSPLRHAYRRRSRDISQWKVGAAHQRVAGRKRGACLHCAPDAQQESKSTGYHLGRSWLWLGLIGVHGQW